MMHDELHRLVLSCGDWLNELQRLDELLEIAIEQIGTTDKHQDRLHLLIEAYRVGIAHPIDEIQGVLTKMAVLLANHHKGDHPESSQLSGE